MSKLQDLWLFILFCITVVGGFIHWLLILCSDDITIETEDEEWSVTFPDLSNTNQ